MVEAGEGAGIVSASAFPACAHKARDHDPSRQSCRGGGVRPDSKTRPETVVNRRGVFDISAGLHRALGRTRRHPISRLGGSNQEGSSPRALDKISSSSVPDKLIRKSSRTPSQLISNQRPASTKPNRCNAPLVHRNLGIVSRGLFFGSAAGV